MGHVGFVANTDHRCLLSFVVSPRRECECVDGKECHGRQCVPFISGACSILQ